MKRGSIGYRGLLAASTAVVLLATGCPGPSGGSPAVPPEVTAAAVTAAGGTLALDQATSVIVTATVLDLGATVTAVIADLSQLGGSTGVPLTLSTTPDILDRDPDGHADAAGDADGDPCRDQQRRSDRPGHRDDRRG